MLGVEVKTKEYKFKNTYLIKSCYFDSFGRKSSLYEIDRKIYSLIKIRIVTIDKENNVIQCEFLINPRIKNFKNELTHCLFVLKLKLRKGIIKNENKK